MDGIADRYAAYREDHPGLLTANQIRALENLPPHGPTEGESDGPVHPG